MRIVIGVDWSDEAFAAVQQTLLLYRPTEVSLVHGIEMGIFEYPALAQIASLHGYEQFQWAVTAAGEELLNRIAATVYSTCASVKQIKETGNPARLIVDTAQSAKADLVVVGARGRGRLAETVLGSVSHRVLMHSPCTTLIVRGGARPIQRVLVAVEGKEDAGRIVEWLNTHPFMNSVELSVLSVVVPLRPSEPYSMVAGSESWTEAATRHANELVATVAASLRTPAYTVHTSVVAGEAAATVVEQAKDMDLIVVATHGRHGLDRFLLGSISHGVVHRADKPVLVIQ